MTVVAALMLLWLALAVLPEAHARMSWRRTDALKNMQHTSFDITWENFNSTLRSLPPNHTCVVEFYASWCPHCHHYAPEYEKASRFFKMMGERKEFQVFVGRVDCADHIRLCGAYKSLMFYPAVGIAPCPRFLSLDDKNITWHHKVKPKDLVSLVSKEMGRPIVYVEVPEPPSLSNVSEPHTEGSKAPPPLWTLKDVESATRMLWQTITSLPSMHTGPEKRQALYDLLVWWSVSHPSEGCKAGALELVQHYNTVHWPLSTNAMTSPKKSLLTVDICNMGPFMEDDDSWVSCKSEMSGMRGFTCALWLLFHTSAARLPAPTATHPVPAQVMVKALRAFAKNFFQCMVCQQHFSQVMSRLEVDTLTSQKDAVMWLWRVHNEVNARLANIEERHGHSTMGDPDFPKIQWPSVTMCPSCINSDAAIPPVTTRGTGKLVTGVVGHTVTKVHWNEANVFAYLNRVFSGLPPQAVMASITTPGAHSAHSPDPVVALASLLMWPIAAVLIAAGLLTGWFMFNTMRRRVGLDAGGHFPPSVRPVKTRVRPGHELGRRSMANGSSNSPSPGSSGTGSPKRRA